MGQGETTCCCWPPSPPSLAPMLGGIGGGGNIVVTECNAPTPAAANAGEWGALPCLPSPQLKRLMNLGPLEPGEALTL